MATDLLSAGTLALESVHIIHERRILDTSSLHAKLTVTSGEKGNANILTIQVTRLGTCYSYRVRRLVRRTSVGVSQRLLACRLERVRRRPHSSQNQCR